MKRPTTTIRVTVPAKIHLLGEHAAVYGKPAILVSVGLVTRVSISQRSDSNISLSSTIFDTLQTTYTEIIGKTERAGKLWKQFARSNDVTILKSIIKTPQDYVIACIGETLLCHKIKKFHGCNLSIDSEIPVGSGLGSSASIGAGIAAALSQFLGKQWNKSDISDITFSCEKLRHGFPSGGDPATVIFGGLVWFRKETPDFRIIEPLPYRLSDYISTKFLLVDTGKPNESTGEMVSWVRSLYEKDKKTVQKIFNSQEELVRELYYTLKDGSLEDTIELIKKGETNLEKLGVVSEPVKHLIRDIEKSGGAAKICGGGGKTKGTGIVLAIHSNKKKVITIVRKHAYRYFDAQLGVKGLSII